MKYRNLWFLPGCITLLIAVCILLFAYLPIRLYNDCATKTECRITTIVMAYLCRNDGVTRECYNVVTKASPAGSTCAMFTTRLTTIDKQLAEQIAQNTPPLSRTCYYCNSERLLNCKVYFSLDDPVVWLWVGASLTITSILLLAAPVVVGALAKWRSARVEEI